MDKVKVSVHKCAQNLGRPYDFSAQQTDVLQQEIELLMKPFSGLKAKIRGASVLVKPNLVRPDIRRLPAMTTDPRVVIALSFFLLDCGAAKVIIGEKPGMGYSARKAFLTAGIEGKLSHPKIRFSCFDEEPWVRRRVPNADLFRNPLVPKAILESEILINLPKMKTHMHTRVSLGLKNFQGIVSDDERMLFHRNDIEHKIVDTIMNRIPDFTMIDGLWPMEGQAPFFGDAIENFNVLLGSENVVAADTVATVIMGFLPEEITHLRLASSKGLGPIDLSQIDVVGSAIEPLIRPFRRPILSSIGVFPGITVIEGGACRGCQSALRHSLDKFQFEGRIADIADLTVVLGKPMPNISFLKNWNGQLILFGNCAGDILFPEQKKRSTAVVIQGCPPHVLDLHRQLS